MGFFDADRDGDKQKVYEEVAEGSRYDFRFALVTDEAARTAAKLQKGPAVLVYAPPRFFRRRRLLFAGRGVAAALAGAAGGFDLARGRENPIRI